MKVSGIVKNIHAQALESAHVVILPDSVQLLTDAQGRFSAYVPIGSKRILISFIGFETYDSSFQVSDHVVLNVNLDQGLNQLKAITIEDVNDRQQSLFQSSQTSTNLLNKDDITSIPVLGGEADVIKTIQLLPGTVRGIEGSSDLFVRGGAADQNLVLLDNAPIYNTSHLFGFLSVFNPETLDNIEAINGGFPARYGGRLSSILNVNTLSSIPDRTQISGDMGLIASRLMIEQPIMKEKASFWIAGRRTYIDQVVKAVGEELPYYFYDLNAKLILKPNRHDEIFLSYYGGEDILDIFRDRNNDGDGLLTTYGSGNDAQSLKWNRQINNRTTSSLSLVRSRYKYDITNIFEDNSLLASSDIEDYNAHFFIQYDSLFGSGSMRSGFEWTRHAISPNVINTAGALSELLKSSATKGRVANEYAFHSDYTWDPFERLTLNLGFRVSSAFINNREYFNAEPRISARYDLASDQAIKLSYSRMAQYIHRISNSAVSTPTDVWYPVTDSIRPQTSHQVAAAWQMTMNRNRMFLSVEGYYKTMEDLVGYEQGTNLFFNTDFESKLIQGSGRAYGIEFLVRKDAGKFTGWISYTLSWSWRKFSEIENGHWFPSRYDRRHNGALVAQYKFHRRWSASAVWEFISGSRFTPIVGQYVMLAPTLTGVDMIPVFTEVNRVRLADTHRLDLGLKFRSQPGKKFQWHWFAGVYNAYNRATPVGISITQDENDGSLHYEQPGLFGLLPFISYGFKL